MEDPHDHLWREPAIQRNPLARELVAVLCSRTGTSSRGFPYLERPAFERLRDWVPHILASGPRVLDATALILDRADPVVDASSPAKAHMARAARVVRQIVFTAAVTAPTDLWLLRHVIGTLRGLGIADRWTRGETVDPERVDGVLPRELRVDLDFLLARGYLVRAGRGFRCSDHQAARRAWTEIAPIEDGVEAGLTDAWRRAFVGAACHETREQLHRVTADTPAVWTRERGFWCATPEEIEIGYRLVPMIIGLRDAGRIAPIVAAGRIDPATWVPEDPMLGASAVAVLRAAGIAEEDGALTVVGERVLTRGPGPFGIIEAYHPYMQALSTLLKRGRGSMRVERRANIAASQDANRATFEAANDALDAFCADTGFRYDVFIEHAIGRGEATRQRFARSGDDVVRYFGADLEDAAIDAALVERDAGRLPRGMRFVRHADIGRPERLVDALKTAGVATEGAVMMVGNGFHEVREQRDESMVAVFRGYEEAGIVLLLTEASALPIDDLLDTGWNTYHAGFKYVHERSGQGLRPADAGRPSAFASALPASWTECATRAGYVRLGAYCDRGRTVYPFTPPSGHNPAISVNHFFVPARIVRRLGLPAETADTE